MPRKQISKSIRFEVFKRDKFACQYCGESAPDVVLHVDHIIPLSKGGADDITNLVTACQSCNLGKSNKKLSDDSAIKKSKAQLDDLQDRMAQIEMMAEWQKQLLQADEDAISLAADVWIAYVDDYPNMQELRITLRKLIKKFGLSEVIESIHLAADRYLHYYSNGSASWASKREAFGKIGGICYNRRQRNGMG